MRLFYSIGIALYYTAVAIASLFNSQARTLLRGWRHWRSQYHFEALDNAPVAWFHAASLGEFEQARPVLEAFRASHPQYKICLSFFSPSGYNVRHNYSGADLVIYLPPDTRRNARHLVERIHPDVVFFVKYEFWFNYMERLHRNNIPFYIFSAIFRPSQYFFRPWGRWFAKQLRFFKHLFVQNEESIRLLNSIGIDHCSIAGDTRFDRVHDIAQKALPNEVVDRFLAGNKAPVVMAGSSWEPDENMLAYFLKVYNKPLKLILAPHVISDTHLAAIEACFGVEQCVRYSAIANNRCPSPTDYKVLIVDNIGLLSSLYRYATVACIGGGFGKGIHNILEAATFGCPVCFGPNHHKFQEALDMIAIGGAATYNDANTLSTIISSWLDNNDAYNQAHQACLQYMQQHLGATQTILNTIA